MEPWEQDYYHTLSYGLFGDTLINSVNYSKLYLGDFCDSAFFNLSEAEFVGGIREDSMRKVYFLKDNSEHIIYDFNLNEGDTFHITFSEFGEDIAFVESVDSFEFNGQYRKEIQLNTSLGWTDPWIEGIGSLTSPIDYIYPYGNFGVSISCIYQNSNLIYQFSPECCKNSIGINILKKPKISVYPNPTNNLITIKLEEIKSYSEYEIINSQGLVIINERIQSPLIKINMENYSNGFYIINLKGKKNFERIKIILY